MGYQLPRIFSKMGSREAAAAGLAALTFAMAGCSNPTEEVNPAVFDTMHAKPVNSYTLLPVMKEKDGKPQPTGRFNLILKRAEMVNTNAVNPEGKSGTMSCSSLSVVPARLNQRGDIEVSYEGGIGRCSSSSSSVVKLQGDTLNLPLENGVENRCTSSSEQLYQHSLNYCKFTPTTAQ